MSTIFPPFDPDDRPRFRRMRQLRLIPLRAVVPNLVTLLALCAGLTSIRMSIELRFDAAIAAIAIAAFLDGIDGRVARFLKSTSRFGAELDSLTDFLNFGVAPAILLYVWALDELRALGWIAAMIFAICGALRLARFNVAIDDPNRPEWQTNYFVGIPAPAGAMVVILPLYLEFIGTPHGFLTAPLVLIYTLVIGFLMVSRVPTWSGKLVGRRINREYVLPLFVLVVLFVALLASYPFETMAVCTFLYLGCLPLSWTTYHRHLAADGGTAAGPNGEPDSDSGDAPSK
jgi:CDP-diacylglycerol---serine O-phosphatidyltransferase